ncbi:MAG: hypothetical protein NUW07_05465, partial [Candidatus Saccharicenans sp.]|nr:hypothetical protein [Candidatus Saccharicenans sp.]
DQALAVEVQRAEGQKCERCWNFSASVGQDPDYPALCQRCSQVLKTETNVKP